MPAGTPPQKHPGIATGSQEVGLDHDTASAAKGRCILLAEDDKEMRELLAWSLLEEGYEVVAARDGIDLCDRLARHLLHSEAKRIDVVVSDVRMPGCSGLDVVTGLRAITDLPPTILITAFGDAEIHRRADEIGVLFLDKPFEIDALLALVRRLLES